MRVTFVPKITNYIGQPMIREVGVIRPPSDFLDLISTYSTKSRLVMDVEGQQGKHEIFFRGPIGLLRKVGDKTVWRSLDLRNLHVFLTDKDKAGNLKVQEEQNPEAVITLIFSDMKERDMAHVKLGTWMSYWETIKTNRVIENELRGF